MFFTLLSVYFLSKFIRIKTDKLKRNDNNMKEMSLEEHLIELKTRLIRIFFILIFACLFSYIMADEVATILLNPLRESIGELGGKVIYLGILDKVVSQFQVALWFGILISAPLWFQQVWFFVKPGLYKHEIKVIRPFIILGLVLFIVGVSFGYFVLFPATFKTLMSFGVSGVEANIGLKDYLLLVCKVLVFLGLLFQIPNVLLILGLMELVTKYSLSKMRRYIYFSFAVISAMITPPDVVTMILIWLPFIFLFEIGILGVSLIVHPYLHRKYGH